MKNFSAIDIYFWFYIGDFAMTMTYSVVLNFIS